MQHQRTLPIGAAMDERQRSSGIGMAQAVARGVTIQSVRNRARAQKSMEYRRVPAGLVARVVDTPWLLYHSVLRAADQARRRNSMEGDAP